MRAHWLDEWESEQEKEDEEFNERAAIMEYDGNLTRDNAEKAAKEIVKQKYPNSILRSNPDV